MASNLFFMPLIVRAIGAPDIASALQSAFAEIQRLGKREEHRRGFAQFESFMEAVACYAQALPFGQRWPVQELLVELAADWFEGSSQERRAALRAHDAD